MFLPPVAPNPRNKPANPCFLSKSIKTRLDDMFPSSVDLLIAAKRPASCILIFKRSIGVERKLWANPAVAPANISLLMESELLPSFFLRYWRIKSFEASLIVFSGAIRHAFMAHPRYNPRMPSAFLIFLKQSILGHKILDLKLGTKLLSSYFSTFLTKKCKVECCPESFFGSEVEFSTNLTDTLAQCWQWQLFRNL